ncbi:MAG: VCBS repeat-containing protein, partial [Candidatus Poseidoniia archaeon]
MRSVSLVAIMLLSLLSAASFTSASVSRTYATNRDPVEVALGDFDCDGDNDVAVATEGTHTISIHWNDGNGDLSKRTDIWVSGETDRVDAEWDDFANVINIEVGEFDGNAGDDIVIYQRNNPFKTDSDGAPAGEPGNITFLNNNGCNDDGFTIGQRYSHFWVWDIAADDLDGDGNDEVVVIDLMADITSQRMVTYQGPISGSTQAKTTSLGPSTTARYTEIMLGDWGESQGIGTTSCMDKDAWSVRLRGADYTTGQYTTQGNDDNVTVIEYNCLTNTFPTDIATATPHTIQMGVGWGGPSIGDMNDDGVIDVLAITDGNVENMSYKTSSTSGTWGNSKIAYFGPYIAWSSFVTDLNGDQEPDFINPTIAEQINSTDSTGQTEENYYLPPPSTTQVTLSDGNGGHLNPLSYQMGRRPSAVAVGQMAGGSSSSLDIVVGQTGNNFGNWVDNMGWEGQYDTISVIEMDNKDLAVSRIEVSPTDRYYG